VIRRSALALVAVFVVQAVAFPISSGADQWTPVAYPPIGNLGITLGGSGLLTGEGLSYISAWTPSALPGKYDPFLCYGITSSGNCDLKTAVSAAASLILPACTAPDQTSCVEGLSIGTSPSTLVPSSLLGQVPGAGVGADSAIGLPEGSTPELWQNPTANGGGSTTYATTVIMQMSYSNGVFRPTQLDASVEPYVEKAGNYVSPSGAIDSFPDGSQVFGFSNYSTFCYWSSNGECGAKEDFTANTDVSLTLRILSDIGGWFAGRIANPSLSISPFNVTNNLMTVQATSVETPMLSFSEPVSQADPTLVSFMKSTFSSSSPAGNYGPTNGNLGGTQAVDASRIAVGNTASGEINQWSFGTTSALGANPCLSNTSEILGVASTNAMAYSSGIPSFVNGYISYSVAGMHYLSGGSLALGTYDLIMRDSVARCLYQYSNAPISASVSITEDSSGDQNAATTTVSDVGGWLHVGAYGFNYSDPVINVKMTQASSAPKVKKTTIACVSVKNKNLVRHVTAVKPRCPMGYRLRK
jgi:hypothetical protein